VGAVPKTLKNATGKILEIVAKSYWKILEFHFRNLVGTLL